MAENKFTGLRQAIKQREQTLSTEEQDHPEPQKSEEQSKLKTKRTRMKWGKSSNPAYRQVTAYVLDDTYQQVQQAIVRRGGGNFSDLVQQLLTKWLQSNK